VFGIGCVGLSILQGAREKKCSRVFAIDTNPKKAEWAKKFGASECGVQACRLRGSYEGRSAWICRVGTDALGAADFVNPKDLPEGKTITQYLIEQTDGGLDFTFDATGNVSARQWFLDRSQIAGALADPLPGQCHASSARVLPQGLGREHDYRCCSRRRRDLHEAVSSVGSYRETDELMVAVQVPARTWISL
jgi:threonine dehydrogenase-like Zn-dependent dehydrogenase